MKILAIDDNALNLEIIEECLEDEGYQVLKALDTVEAMRILDQEPKIKAILLDKMLPNEDGIDFLRRLKKIPKYKTMPVILQTAATDQQGISESISAGAYYYLTKPYKENLLLSVITAAIKDSRLIDEINLQVKQHQTSLGLLKSAEFSYKNAHEAENVSFLIANSFPDPQKVVVGLVELTINAIEHGNLGLSYNEKKTMITNGTFSKEMILRAQRHENKDKYATIAFKKTPQFHQVTIEDQGQGFNWKKYLDFSPERAEDPNGRGIFMARTYSFDSVEYKDCGNKVVCKVFNS
jgi:CheY-like chemotaxis protein